MSGAQIACRQELVMNIDYLVVGLIAAGLLAYLIGALLKPERL